jgi:hypothetical protein
MSYTEYLRTKLAAEKKVVNVKNTTDASMATTKVRMIASRFFRQDGTSVGSMVVGTDRPTLNHRATSYVKASGRTPDCGNYTTFRGNVGIGEDKAYRDGGRKVLPCVDPTLSPPTPVVRARSGERLPYGSASSATSAIASCPRERGDPISDIQFSDNTIRLSASHPRMVATDGCCDHKIEHANHTPSPGIQVDVDNQRYAVGKPFFMSDPPLPQGPNVSDHKVGGYIGPRSKYVENKHGFAGSTPEIPKAPGPQGQTIAHLNINKPNLGNIKSLQNGPGGVQ